MNKHIGRLLRILLTVAIIVMMVIFARTVNWADTWKAIRSASLSILVLAALVNLLSLAVKGVRWWVFLRPVGAESLWLAIRATFAGAGLNNVLVANGGEAARVIFVSRAAHLPSAKVLATLALERLFELIGYFVMLALAVTFLALPPGLSETRPLAILALVIMAALVVYLIRHPEKADVAPAAIGAGWPARAKAYAKRFARTLTSISTGPRFAAALLLSVIAWALQVATYMLTAKAAHFHLGTVGTIAAILAVNLGFAIRATPGNVGVFQMMYAVTAAAFGMDKDAAIGVAFLIQTQQILPVTAIGIGIAPELLFKRRRTPRPDNILPGEPVLETATGED